MSYYQISVYVPVSHTEQVKEALFTKGAGRLGNYDCCSWQVLGEGQFRPREGSQPFLGSQNELEKVLEYRVETICHSQYLEEVIIALKASHPYEQPAYVVVPLESFAYQDTKT